MKQNYFIKLVSVLTVFTLIVSCGNKTNQGKGLLEAAVEMVDPRAGTVDMGFPAENGKPLYWAKGNLVAKADGTFIIAPTPEYIASSRYYSDESKEWDLFGWATQQGRIYRQMHWLIPARRKLAEMLITISQRSWEESGECQPTMN
ncbi:MAG: hypothetical protein RRZ65_09270 [Tannerellaceae bacterium]